MKSVLIIINNKDDGKFLSDLFYSLVLQDNQDFSVVGIDAGSKDNSVEIYKSYNVPVVDCTNLNQAQSVNKVLRNSDEPFIGWINADDFYKDNYISAHLEVFDNDHRTDIVYSDCEMFWQEDRYRPSVVMESKLLTDSALKETNPIYHPTVMFRRRVLEKIGFLDENLTYAVDYEFWVRAYCSGIRFRYIPYVTAVFRNRTDNLSHRFLFEVLKEKKYVQKKYGFI